MDDFNLVKLDFDFASILGDLRQIEAENKCAINMIMYLETEIHQVPLTGMLCHIQAVLYHAENLRNFLNSLQQKMT